MTKKKTVVRAVKKSKRYSLRLIIDAQRHMYSFSSLQAAERAANKLGEVFDDIQVKFVTAISSEDENG